MAMTPTNQPCTEPLQCPSYGPRVRAASGVPVGYPRCVQYTDHDGPHRAHESWGEVTW